DERHLLLAHRRSHVAHCVELPEDREGIGKTTRPRANEILFRFRRIERNGRRLFVVCADARERRSVERQASAEPAIRRVDGFGLRSGYASWERSRGRFWFERSRRQ